MSRDLFWRCLAAYTDTYSILPEGWGGGKAAPVPERNCPQPRDLWTRHPGFVHRNRLGNGNRNQEKFPFFQTLTRSLLASQGTCSALAGCDKKRALNCLLSLIAQTQDNQVVLAFGYNDEQVVVIVPLDRNVF